MLLLLLLAVSLPSHGEMLISRIEVIIPPNNAALADLAGGINHALQQLQPAIPVVVRSADSAAHSETKNTLLIAVGDNLLPMAVAEKNNYGAAIAFYVNSTNYLTQSAGDERITALFRDQPLARQLQLAKAVLPNLHRVGIIHGHKNLPTPVATLARNTRLDIQAIDVEEKADWPKYLSQLMLDNDVLLGIDDPAIYNGETIRSILLTTYRHGKFLIGPSRAFVGAGSLASCYTSPDQYLQQLTEMVGNVLRTQKLPHPQYPRTYGIAVNPQVAASLGLSIQDEKTLTARLQNLVGECGDGC